MPYASHGPLTPPARALSSCDGHFFARKRCVGIKRACSMIIWRARVRAGLGIGGAPTCLHWMGGARLLGSLSLVLDARCRS